MKKCFITSEQFAKASKQVYQDRLAAEAKQEQERKTAEELEDQRAIKMMAEIINKSNGHRNFNNQEQQVKQQTQMTEAQEAAFFMSAIINDRFGRTGGKR